MIGRCGEVQRLGRSHYSVVARALESQRALKVQKLAHEVKIGRDVGLLHFDYVVRVVHGQVELLHEVRHRYGNRTADTGQAVNEDTTLQSAGLICGGKKTRRLVN